MHFAPERCTPKTGRPHCANQISPRPRRWTSRPAVSGSPVLPWNWPSFRSVPAPGTQRNWHGAIATVPGGCDAVTDPAKFCSGSAHGVGMTERRRLRCSCLRARAASLLPRHSHNTYCVFGRSSHINSIRADSPRAGTLQPGIYVTQYGVVCSPASSLSHR